MFTNAPRVFDVIVRRRKEPLLYELRQVGARGEKFLEGPYRRDEAELRAIDLAKGDKADAWVVGVDDALVLLT
jgi:hypothetical protein